MIVNSVICRVMLFVCSNAYPTIRCLEILRKTEDVYVLKKWLSFFVVRTIFETIYYFISTLLMFPVEIELFILLFMIASDAKGSFLLYNRLQHMGLSNWTRPLENVTNFLKTCDSEDIIRVLDRYCNIFYEKAFFWEKKEETSNLIQAFPETEDMGTEESNTSIESLGSSVQIVDHNEVLNESIETDKSCDEISEKCDETNKEMGECEVNKHRPKKRIKKTE